MRNVACMGQKTLIFPESGASTYNIIALSSTFEGQVGYH